MKPQLLFILSLSGAGRSTSLRAPEDMGFYCLDHVPVSMVENALAALVEQGHSQIVVALPTKDAGWTQADGVTVMNTYQRQGWDVYTVMLTARPDVLVKRYHETRRPHPLGRTRTTDEAIQLEMQWLNQASVNALVMDTSELSAAALSEKWRSLINQWGKEDTAAALVQSMPMRLVVQSFGFKYGIPQDVDLMMDARCLPNPHYVPELKHQTGLDSEVQQYFETHPEMDAFVQDIEAFLKKWYGQYVKDARTFLHVAIGCTGGQHRSVYVAEQLVHRLRGDGYPLHLTHREEKRWPRDSK